MAKSVIPKIPKLGSYTGRERRKRRRTKIEDLNQLGFDKLKLKAKDLDPADSRSAITKVFDAIDVPRNLIANVIGSLAGVKKRKLRKGALGVPAVYMSDVLKKLGIKNKVALGALGLASDVLVDPLTYATLGATTGLSVAKSLPKVLKPGIRLLKQGAQAAAKGQAIPGVVAKALGGQARVARVAKKLVARYGSKNAAKMLMNPKRGGILSRTLASRAHLPGKAEGAHRFLKLFGEQGRTVARLPFAAKGLTSPWGKRARLYKELSGPTALAHLKGVAAATAKTAAAGKVVSRISGLAGKQKAAEAARATQGQAAAAKLAQELAQKTASPLGKLAPFQMSKTSIAGAAAKAKSQIRGMGLTTPERQALVKGRLAKLKGMGTAAKGSAQEARAVRDALAMGQAPGAPLMTKLHQAEKIGAEALKELPPGASAGEQAAHKLRRIKNYLFGPGASVMGRQRVAAQHRAAVTSKESHAAAAQQFAKILQPVVDDVATKTKIKPDAVMSMMYDLVDRGGVAGLKGLHRTDPVRVQVHAAMGLFGNRPDVQKALGQARTFLDDLHRQAKAAGVAPAKIKEYVKRVTDPAFAKAAAARGAKAGPGAYVQPRVQRVEWAFPDKSTHTSFTSNEDEMKRLGDAFAAQGGKQAGGAREAFDVSAEQWNVWQKGKTPFPKEPGAESFRSIVHPEFKGAQFSKDLPEAIGASAADTERRLAAGQVRDLALQHGVRATPKQLARDPLFQKMVRYDDIRLSGTGRKITETPFHAFAGRALEGIALPQPVADMIDEAARISAKPEELNTILRWSDKFLKVWKPIALMHPAYPIRNVVENSFGITREGISLPRTYARLPQMQNLVQVLGGGGDISRMSVRLGGKTLPATEFVKAAKKYNMLNAGFTSMVLDEGMFMRAKSLLPRLGKKWFEFNNRIENTMRLSAFATLIDDGMTARQAALKTIRAMPDLTDLSLFERNVMKRIFPWYSWLRRNGSNVFKLAVEKPAILAGTEHFRRNAEIAFQGDKVVDPMLRPQFHSEAQAMQVLGDEKRGSVFLLGSWLPFSDLLMLFEAADSPSEFSRGLLSRLRPDAKFLVEMGVGQDIFRRRPTEPFTTAEIFTNAPAAFVGRSGTSLDALLSIRPLKEGVRTAKDIEGVLPRVGRVLMGGAFQPVSVERGKKMKARELSVKERKLRSAIRRAKSTNSQAELARAVRDFFAVQKEKKELGLPVAKATARRLEQLEGQK